MGVGSKTDEKILKFNYQNETYYGKVYLVNLSVSVFLGALIFNLSPRFLGALIRNEEIKDISIFSGNIRETIFYFIGLFVGILCVYLLERIIWKIIRGDRKIELLQRNKYVKNNSIPMTQFQVKAGLYVTFFTLLLMWFVIVVLTGHIFAIAACEVTGIYFADICITSHMMNKYRCDYYIPLDFAGGVVGVKKDNVLNCNIYNRNMVSRNIQNNYYV